MSAGGRSVHIDGEYGALIYALLGPDGEDLLAVGNPPRPELRQVGDLGATGFRGWIDCFPTIAPEPDKHNGRPSLNLTAHGELWNTTWQTLESSSAELSMKCDITEIGVTYVRTVRLTQGSMLVSSRVENRGTGVLLFVWASHPLFAVDPEMWIELDDSPFTTWPESELNGERLDDLWPPSGSRRRWIDLPSGFARKLFLPWPEGGVKFHAQGEQRRVDFSVVGDIGPVQPHLGLWLNKGGFPADAPLHHFAIEPTIGDSDSLDASARRNTAGRLEPESTVEFVVQLDF